MKLEVLIAGLARPTLQKLSAEQRAFEVSTLTAHSEQVVPGTVFFALPRATPGKSPGSKSKDGFDFIPDAVRRGAILVIGEREPTEADEERAGGPGLAAPGVPYIRVPVAAVALSQLTSVFFNHPSRTMKVIGVTGTSGKTTSTYLLESILRESGQRVGVIGTVNIRFPGKVLEATHTTPGPFETQALLARMRDEGGCTAVVMEVSSHALKQHRVAGVAFDAMLFTNLTPEHLDYHPSIEDYFQSKLLLFTAQVHASVVQGKRPALAINADDPFGARILALLSEYPVQGRVFASFGLETPGTLFSGAGLTIGASGVRGRVLHVEIDSPLACRFNAYNILGAVSTALGLGIAAEAISRGIASLKLVPGRIERVLPPEGIAPDSRPVVYVDYAHKSDALRKVLEALQPLAREQGGRLITVFGGGGDRDREKRPVMGKIASELSDQVWITSDNPRTEDPGAIISEIQAGIADSATSIANLRLRIEPDRARAIDQAIRGAKPSDVVLIAGKGHEDYQVVGTEKRPFDDRKQARLALT